MGSTLVVALVSIGIYAMTHHGHTTSPSAHFVRRHLRQGRPVRPHMRGVGKPSLVFVTLMSAMIIAAFTIRVAV